MKKILSILLLLSMLLCTFCACGDKEKEEGVKALSGEVGDDLIDCFITEGERGTDFDERLYDTFTEYEEYWNGTKHSLDGFGYLFKKNDELSKKQIKKVSFTIEADKEVSIRFSLYAHEEENGVEKLVTLKANEPTKVEVKYDGEKSFQSSDDKWLLYVEISQNSESGESSAEQKETKFVLTEFDVFVK